MTNKTNKLSRYFKIVLIFITITALVATVIFWLNVSNLFSRESEVVVYQNEFYALKGKPTDYQQAIFQELTKQIDLKIKDDKILAELVAKNFVADHYTWSNKIGAFDVGGSNFVMPEENLNFFQTSRRYFYSEIYDYIQSGLLMSDLIEVENVNVVLSDYANYTYYDQTFFGVYVILEWTYKENEKVDTSKFQNTLELTLIFREEGRVEIARFY